MHEGEPARLALFASLGGVAVSVINEHSQEVALLSLKSAPAMWEVEVKHKWKVLDNEFATWLEEKWRTGEPRAYLDVRIEVYNLWSNFVRVTLTIAILNKYYHCVIGPDCPAFQQIFMVFQP